MRWSVYIIACAGGELYTGVSTDVERRLAEHAGGGARAARYLRGRGPLRLAWVEPGHTRASACRREAGIKKLPRAAKLALIAAGEGAAPPAR